MICFTIKLVISVIADDLGVLTVIAGKRLVTDFTGIYIFRGFLLLFLKKFMDFFR